MIIDITEIEHIKKSLSGLEDWVFKEVDRINVKLKENDEILDDLQMKYSGLFHDTAALEESIITLRTKLKSLEIIFDNEPLSQVKCMVCNGKGTLWRKHDR